MSTNTVEKIQKPEDDKIDTLEELRENQNLNPINNVGQLFDLVGDFVETRMEIIKLQGTQKVSSLVSWGSLKVVLGAIAIFFMLILNIGIGFWLGELLGKVYYGFFALAGFYFLIGVVLYLFREKIRDSIENGVIQKIL